MNESAIELKGWVLNCNSLRAYSINCCLKVTYFWVKWVTALNVCWTALYLLHTIAHVIGLWRSGERVFAYRILSGGTEDNREKHGPPSLWSEHRRTYPEPAQSSPQSQTPPYRMYLTHHPGTVLYLEWNSMLEWYVVSTTIRQLYPGKETQYPFCRN